MLGDLSLFFVDCWFIKIHFYIKSFMNSTMQ